jgi:adenine deaminase
MDLRRLLAAAREMSPPTFFRERARLVNVFRRDLRDPIAISGDSIVGLGPGYRAKRSIDV